MLFMLHTVHRLMMPPIKRLDWSPKKHVTAVTLRSEGYSIREIADNIGGGATQMAALRISLTYKQLLPAAISHGPYSPLIEMFGSRM